MKNPDLLLTLLLTLLTASWRCDCASVRRPSTPPELLIDFEGVAPICEISEAVVVFDEYAASLARFSGPGFGKLNGGAVLGACAFSSGAFPPLGNHSFDGSGMLGFSTLHLLTGNAKAISPETIRFDVRVTNILLHFAGIDEKEVTVELHSGPGDSYDDAGVLLRTFTLQMSSTLQRFELIDEKELFVDCVRRLVFYSPAKIFLLDNLHYSVSAASDGVCSDSPSTASSDDVDSAAPASPSAATPSVPSRSWWLTLLLGGTVVAGFMRRR